MDFPLNEFYMQVVKDFETAYTMFLLEHRLIHSPAVQATFYAVCEKMVRSACIIGSPIMQAAIQRHLHEMQQAAMYGYEASVEQIFGDVVINNSVRPT